MRHRKVQTTKRHKKIKVIQAPSRHNIVNDKVLSKNCEQTVPRKLAEIMNLKTVIQNANAEKLKKKKNKRNTIDKSVSLNKSTVEMEHGMTRMPSTIPDKIEKKSFETHRGFMNRISKIVSKAINDANIEEHFDVDLNPKIDSPKSKRLKSKN